MSDIGRVFLTKSWIFQAVLAGPTFVLLGMSAVIGLYGGAYFTIYDFVTDMSTAILAAGIIFIVLAQRQLPAVGMLWTFRFELAKSTLATLLWIWLMADSIWGPKRYYYDYQRTRRIIASSIAIILLFLFFYPSAFYTHYELRKEPVAAGRPDEEEAERSAGEREPLLGNEAA